MEISAPSVVEGPAALIERASREADDANRKRTATFLMTLFTAICAPIAVALLGWGGSYISDIARAGQQRDKDQAVFMARIDARFDAIQVRTETLSMEMKTGFADVKKKQEEAEQNSKDMERRIGAVEREVLELKYKAAPVNPSQQTQKRP